MLVDLPQEPKRENPYFAKPLELYKIRPPAYPCISRSVRSSRPYDNIPSASTQLSTARPQPTKLVYPAMSYNDRIARRAQIDREFKNELSIKYRVKNPLPCYKADMTKLLSKRDAINREKKLMIHKSEVKKIMVATGRK